MLSKLPSSSINKMTDLNQIISSDLQLEVKTKKSLDIIKTKFGEQITEQIKELIKSVVDDPVWHTTGDFDSVRNNLIKKYSFLNLESATKIANIASFQWR